MDTSSGNESSCDTRFERALARFDAVYSYRNDSIGSRLAALMAG